MDTVVHPPSAGAYRRDALWLALLAVAYFLAQELAFLLPGALKVVAAVWPAGGIGLAALLLSPRRRWPAILLTLFLAGMAANSAGRPLATGVGYMIANLAESLGCAWLISRWCGETVRFRRVKEVLALIVCVTAVNAGSALIGAGTATLAHASPFRDAWLTWWVADGLGILLVTPLIVTWSGVRQWFGGLRWGRTLESGLFLAAWCAAGWWTFQPAAHFHALSPQPYMLVGLLAWPALRLGQREVTLAMVVLAAMTLAGEAVYTGPLLWGGADPVERLLAVQVWIAFIAATGLLLTASYAEAQSAERSAREEHMRLQALGDNLPHGMVYQVVGDRDGSRRFQYVSSGSRELMGVSPEELLSDPSAFSSLIVEEDRPAFAAAQKASAGAMSVFDVSVRIRRRDGAVRWMQLSSTPRRLPDGRVLWDGILLDVTDRQREAAARLESEVRFRLVVKNAELPVLITSISDGTVLFANQCAARYFDVPQAEAMGLNAPDFWRDPAARARFSQTLVEAGRVVGLEVELLTRTGQARWASASANVINYDGQSAAFIVFSDITALKEAAAKLERERGVLSAIFQTVPDMIWMKDAEGRYVACNAATERFFVLPASAIIGRKDHEIFPSEIADVIRAEDRAAIAAGSLLLAHAWVPVGDDGRQVLLETNKTPMLDGEGRLAGILCVARDVTAAHMAQEVLRQRVALAQQLEKTAAAAPGALFSFCQRADGTWFLPYASPAFEDVYGVPPENYAEDATGYWDLLHPEDLDGAVRAIEEARRASSIVRLEYRVRHAKKGERWVEGRAVPVAQPDGSTVWYGFVTDISDRKLAEAALEEGVARRRILFEQSKDGIAILDLNGKVQEANQAFAHLLGYTQEEMRELHVWDWNAQWTREELLSKVAGFFAVPATFETRHRRKDGSLLDVEVSASGVEFGGRKFVYSMARDITIRKAADAALRESRRLEGIGILAGGMAHEFNNLLTVINGYSSLLLRGFDVHDPVRVQIDAIRAAGERAANLTQQLLAFGRKQIIRPAVLDLNMVVERSRPAWMPLLRPNISLRMEPDPSAGLVSIDADRMREVIVNLVTNAIQALPNGGELMIATANVHIGEDYVARHADAQPGWYVMLSVADTGIGMDEKTRARVFEPFFTTRGRAIATGLGLATVHGSVAQHRGWITVESALGKGSVFKIYLPRAGERAEPDGSAADLSGIPNRRATVLVVDEEDAVRRLTVSILKAHGYQTLEAANGSHALAAAEGHKGPIQLILTDVILPGMTGRELARQLRARMPAAKVLYVSGYPEDVIASHAGEGAFIQKPYSPDLLLAKVAEMLD